jgi:Leucine-rich repeat (LRR) protein
MVAKLRNSVLNNLSMKFTLYILISALSLGTIQAQSSYIEAIRQGDAAFANGQYKKAINKYFAAEAFEPEKKEEVKARVNKVFEKIEVLRMEAEEARGQAQRSRDTTKAALAKAQQLIDAFYFYDDKFALAYKEDRFYFINKDGEQINKLGKWYKIEQFDSLGFAKAQMLVENSVYNYLIDTSGNYYTAEYELANIGWYSDVLFLNEKKLDVFPKKIFKCRSLIILNLANNQLVSLPAEIEQFGKLMFLDLTSNKLIDLPEQLRYLKGLEKLFLSGNQLKILSIALFELKNLIELRLDFNKIENLPLEVSNLQNLKRLLLIGNRLREVPVTIGTLKNLEELNLSRNRLEILPAELGEIKTLNKLYLDLNELTVLPKEIGNLQNLIELKLSWNEIKTLPVEIENLRNLRILDLRENKLSTIVKPISKLKNLKNLYLTGNPIPSSEIEKIKNRLPNCKVIF